MLKFKCICAQEDYMFYQKFLGVPTLGVNTKTMFVCYIALRPKSTAMVIAGRSVHLTTLFPGQA